MAPTATLPPVPRPSWRAFAAVSVVLVIGQGSIYLVAAALPLYLHHLGASTASIGLEVGASNLTATACTLVAGPSINRWGPHRLLLAGMGCYLLAALGLLGLPSVATATLCRALQGVGLALVLPSALTMAPRLVPLRPGAALGAVGSLSTLAMAVGPPLGLWLYAHGGPLLLFTPAAMCAVLGLGVGFALPTLPRPANPIRGLGYERRWTAALLVNALGNAYFGGILAYLPLMLAHGHGPNAGIFFTADALGVLLLRVPSGALVDRSGPRLAQLVGIMLTLAGLGALALPLSTATLVAAGAGTGIGAALLVSAVLVSLTKRSGEHNRGTAMSLAGTSISVGVFASSALSGALIGPGGFSAVLLFGAFTTAAALPLVLLDRATGSAA